MKTTSAFAPLPEAAGPAALTGMIWLPVLATLVDNMTPLADRDRSGFGLATLVAVTANAGFASGVTASFFLPITRLAAARGLERLPTSAPGELGRLRSRERDPLVGEVLERLALGG